MIFIFLIDILIINFENIRENIMSQNTILLILYPQSACYHFIIMLICSHSISLLNIYFASEIVLSDMTTGKYDNVVEL